MNNDTDRPRDSFPTTHRWRAMSSMCSPTPHPIPRPDPTAERSNKITSLAYGGAETALGTGCNMIRCLPNSISEFRLAVYYVETKFGVTAVTETRPKPKCDLRP